MTWRPICTSLRARAPAMRRLALAGLLLCTVGCGTGGRLDVESRPAADPEPARELFERFDNAVWGQRGNGPYNAILMVARSRGTPTPDRPGGSEQLLVVELDWLPRTTKLNTDPTMISARYTWLVRSAGGMLAYQGAGFAYPQNPFERGRPTSRLSIEIDSGTLQRTAGDPGTDELGEVRIRGRMVAELDSVQARHLFTRARQEIAELRRR